MSLRSLSTWCSELSNTSSVLATLESDVLDDVVRAAVKLIPASPARPTRMPGTTPSSAPAPTLATPTVATAATALSTFGSAADTDVSTFTLRAASARCEAVSVYCDASAFAYARRTSSATGSSSGSPLRSARSSAVSSLRASIPSFGSSAASAVSSDADTSDTLRTSGSSR